MDISAISDSVSVMSVGYQLPLFLDFKVVKWTKNFNLLNLCGNQLIGIADYAFVASVFGENMPTAEFGMISAETACWDI